jgi:ABC-type Mn2+/Zn2+ transport system permease subunit
LLLGYSIAGAAYALGLGLSLLSDFPPGPLIVCVMTLIALPIFVLKRAKASDAIS